MRFLHTADTHLGYAAYNALSPEGLNQRERDVFKSFAWVIDRGLELRVDAVVHSGDLFDSVRPSNRAISFALEQVLRLKEEEIPFIVISGNHDTPRMRRTGSVLKIFDHLPHVHPIYGTKPGRVEVGDVLFQGMGYVPEKEAYMAGLKEMGPDGGFSANVAVLHVGVDGLSVFKTGEFNEVVVPQGSIPAGFDYVALGHYHEQVEAFPGGMYAGSLERLSLSEAGHSKGALLVDTDTWKAERVPFPPRVMMTFEIDGSGMSSSDILDAVKELPSPGNREIVSLKIVGLDKELRKNVNLVAIKKHFDGALHLKLTLRSPDPEGGGSSGSPMRGLESELDEFIRSRKVSDELVSAVRSYLGGVK